MTYIEIDGERFFIKAEPDPVRNPLYRALWTPTPQRDDDATADFEYEPIPGSWSETEAAAAAFARDFVEMTLSDRKQRRFLRDGRSSGGKA